MLARGFAVAMLAVAGSVPVTASASTHSTICVGLVIDSQSIGGTVSAHCVNVKAGTTGVGVLEAAGHTLTFRRDGLLCTIDDVPSSGCSEVDDTHYWAYFHRAPDATSWSYSNEGMSTYQPANRSTEGWVYDDGTKLEPKNVPASQMCKALLKPTPTPAPSRTHRVRTAPSPRAARSATPSARPKPATTARVHAQRSQHAARSPSRSATTEGGPAPSATAAALGSSGGHGSATGAIVAAAVVAVLAAATFLVARRRRR